ncbi:hypothetical protein VSR33_38220, partial [Burkholderia sp. JPY164]
DLFVVVGKSSHGTCDANNFPLVLEADRLETALRGVPGVQTTTSVGGLTRWMTSGFYEGYPKWYTIDRVPSIINKTVWQIRKRHFVAAWTELKPVSKVMSVTSSGGDYFGHTEFATIEPQG